LKDLDALRNREYQRLRHWGLLEPSPEGHRTHEENSKDIWRVTPKGEAFVLGKVSVPRIAFIYDNTLFGFGNETVDVMQALRNKFNYGALMG
jgi:hypothetical protein